MKKDLRTELGKVRGFGSAHTGTEHFWLENLVSFVNVLLWIFFIVLVMSCVGKDHSIVHSRFSHPVVTVLMGLMIFSSLYYMKLGMQVVIEDYIPHEGMRILFFVLNILFCFILGGIMMFALLKITLGV
ncbi:MULTISPECIES: succinate dehydrogenase, hydrophobic membrane anchor protein [unclassified Bartonella]|uniref:succinate dehydrogenase, hydrophobic membrane anchor protein n=1 Tax=unclassified Bartonella TaxID=2645622 RepID=UPI00099AA05D|nr:MULTISPECIES: succinate dehydrogenase, hydrophobic membrane anchor protein [unclassified Bartonella]AQX28520.1 succinate dehydrogenase subunit D [Bartonella sp. JB15]AQX29784.1 succinate dehydrogenase subunit D [Bartonella sp. JB63]